MPIRFAIVGSGWRAMYYVRIAKALPHLFELCALLCRTKEKAEKIAFEYGIQTLINEEEMLSLKPEFVVVAVDKASVASLSMHYLEKGIPVLSETPTALDKETILKLWDYHKKGAKHIIAEQYQLYPTHQARGKLIENGRIGTPHYLYLSMAHEYHGFSLMRMYLELNPKTGCYISAKEFTFPVTETLSRYEKFTDGRIATKKRVTALFEFDNSKACHYDFDSEQYRSRIRYSAIRVLGEKGEVFNDSIRYLDADLSAKEETLKVDWHTAQTEYENPNLREVHEVEKITFGTEELFAAPFGLCALGEDETAIAILLKKMGDYVRGEGEEPYPLSNALMDAYAAILLKEAIQNNERVRYEWILK